MKKLASLALVFTVFLETNGQWNYDSITISRFLVQDELMGKNWKDTLNAGRFPNYIAGEKKAWDKSNRTVKLPAIITLLNKIKANGTEDVAKCFIPRHSVNYYKSGKIVKYLLVCFECDGLRFSDDPPKTFVKSATVREKQMAELKEIFKPIEAAPAKADIALYDSITIAKIKGDWTILDPGGNDLLSERKIWKDGSGGNPVDILALTDSIRKNGTGPIGRCFFPRHRINYYKDGIIVLYLLVCFECNELQFSNDNFPEMFVKDKAKRMQQMDSLRIIFKDLMSKN